MDKFTAADKVRGLRKFGEITNVAIYTSNYLPDDKQVMLLNEHTALHIFSILKEKIGGWVETKEVD